MMTSGEELPDNVKLVIQDCGYTSVYNEMAFQIKRLFKLRAFPIIHATSLYAKLQTGFRFKEASCINQIKKNRLPILMIHGEVDNFAPYFMLDELMFRLMSPRKRIMYRTQSTVVLTMWIRRNTLRSLLNL